MIYLEVHDNRLSTPPRLIHLYQPIFVVGRHTKISNPLKPCHLLLKDQRISLLHCYLFKPVDHLILHDNYTLFDGQVCKDAVSKNGVFVNDERVNIHRLKHNDNIHLGEFYSITYNNTNQEDQWRKTL